MVLLDPYSLSLSEMKLKLLYSLFQSEDGIVKMTHKISLLQYFGDALERQERSVTLASFPSSLSHRLIEYLIAL
jgi:hypothetical protein